MTTPSPPPSDIFAAVGRLIGELSRTPPDAVGADDRLLEDLGLDSLQTMELLSRLAEEFDVDPDMDAVVNVTRVKDVVALLARELAAA